MWWRRKKDLSDQEIKSLLEKAERAWESWYSDSRKHNIGFLEESLEAYNKIIENTPPHPHYFMKRARIKSALASLRNGFSDGAIEDINRAIEIEKAIPDDASHIGKQRARLSSILSVMKRRSMLMRKPLN